MAFSKLEAHEKRVAEAKAAEAAEAKRLELKRAVRAVLPKSVRVPKRGRGRTAVGGVSRKEVAAMRAQAVVQLDGDAGLQALETEVQRNALVILKIDGLLGTEPWRASGGPHGGIVSANARLRYVENAIRLLDDLRRRQGQGEPGSKMLEGVIDAEIVK